MKTLPVLSIIILTCLFSPCSAMSAYVATGPFEVTSCKGFGIYVCGSVTIDAVSHDGKKYSMKKVWEEVDRHSHGTCYLNTVGKSVIPFLADVLNPTFYHYDQTGYLKKIKNIEGSVSFPCKESR